MSFWRTISTNSRSLLRRSKSLGASAIRGYAKKHNPSPTCAKKTDKKSDEICVDDHPKARTRAEVMENFPWYHMIKFKDECCDTDCPDKDFPSFDECLYKESDKNKRKYQVTWVECPRVAIKPKKICCFANVKRPPIVRRKPKEKPNTACKMEVPCPPSDQLACPRIEMPGCRPVRDSVKCHKIRWPSDCQKVRTPYPAFSECRRPKLRKRRTSECHCHDEIPMCDLIAQLNKRLRRGPLVFSPCQKS